MDQLAKAIEVRHHAKAFWEATVPVCEVSDGKVLWEGNVEVYRLIGNDQAIRCYAWEVEAPGGQSRIHSVLQEPPIKNAADAVHAVLVAARKS